MTGIERTQSLLTRRLGLPIELAPGEAYRAPEGLGLVGDWMGGFAQPGLILNPATAMRMSFADAGGSCVDEYGESHFEIVEAEGERVIMRKRYVGKGLTGEFVYVGRLHDGMLAGYWYSPLRPAFCGVFWLARSERLAETTRAAFDRRVRSHSVKKAVLYAALLVIVWGAIAGALGYPRIALLVVLACLAGRFIYVERADSLRREVELWKRELV